MRIENTSMTADLKQHVPNQATQLGSALPNQEGGDHNLDQVQKAVNKFNDMAEPLQTNLRFRLHEKLHEYYVEVVDTKTDEVIKEIPSRKVLDMYAAMAELMGLLEDRKL